MHGLNPNEVTLAEVFKSKDYSTAIFGKWHLGDRPEFLPTRQGFDEFYGIPYSNDLWPYNPWNPGAFGDLPMLENETVVGHNLDQTRYTTDFTKRSVEFIERNAVQRKPFFLYLAHPMPHVPVSVSRERMGLSGVGVYGDVIQEIDWSVGQVLKTIERMGISHDTLVIFTSDNGPSLRFGNHAGSAGPLREGKGSVYEGGVRVPFIAQLPGEIPAGLEVATPAMTIDLLPTLAKLIGAELPKSPIDGKSIWPLLTGTASSSPHDAYYFYYEQNELQAMRSGKWKLHFPHRYETSSGREPGKDGMAVEIAYAETQLALYDLERDISESNDVSDQFPEVVEELSRMAEAKRTELGDTLTGANGPGLREPGRAEE
jgi:arylsulfatase